MRKLAILLIVVLTFSACKKEKDPVTTYQIINNSTVYISGIDYFDASMYQVTVFHYNGTDIVKQDNITKIASGGGKSDIINVPSNSQKIKISFKFLPPESPLYSLSSNHWINITAFTIIVKGQNNIVTMDDHTIVGDGLGKSNIGTELFKVSKGLVSKPID
jgi:hypothetical protein